MVKIMKEALIKKLEKYEQVIQCIGSTAQSVIQPETKAKLFAVHAATTELLNRVKNNSFEIAIVGLEKAGKSTFANALIGLDILPTKEERCTYTSSCVKYASQTYAEVEFFTAQEFNERFESSIKALGISLETYEYGKVSLSDLQKMTNDIVLNPEKRNILEDLTDMIKSEAEIMHWLGKAVQHFNADEMQTSTFKNLVQNPDRVEGQYVSKPAFAVKKITVFSDKLADMRNCIIYDVPGFDSPTAIHMEQTRERMDLADAVILIANASKPSLTGPQVNIFRSSVDSDGIPFNEKIFVFANRADESRNLQYNLGVLKDDLHKYSILRSVNDDRLIAGSAFAYLCRLSGSQTESAQQAITNLQNNGITDGIEEIKKKLEQYNNVVRIRVIEKRVDNLEKSILEIIEEIKVACGNISLTSGSNVDMLKSFLAVQSKFKEKLVSYRSDIRNILVEKPLTSSILSVLQEELNPEELYPTESEIAYLKKESTQGIAQFESKLRELKRFEVRERFDNITLGITEDLKRKIVDEIIEKLLDSLEVTSDHIYYEEIKSMSKEYIEKFFNDFNFNIIHKALTLRFSYEVFEILINKPFLMPDRMEYFQDNMENIVSLALYSQNVRDAIRNDSRIDATSLPMINSILFHEGFDHSNTNVDLSQNDITAYIGAIIKTISPKLQNECAKLESLAEQSINWCLDNAIDINYFIRTLNSVMPDLRRNKYSSEKEFEAIKYYLNQTMDQVMSQKMQNAQNSKPLRERYLESSKSRINSHDWVIEKFKEDICILISIISGPVVNAIQLEVPFVANLMDIIDKIKQNVQDKSAQFIDFYGKVYPKSEYKKVEEIESIQQTNNEKQAILDGINSLLEEMK